MKRRLGTLQEQPRFAASVMKRRGSILQSTAEAWTLRTVSSTLPSALARPARLVHAPSQACSSAANGG